MAKAKTGPRYQVPAMVKRTGKRQLSVELTQAQAKQLEHMRVVGSFRSWGEVLRALIDAQVTRRKGR